MFKSKSAIILLSLFCFMLILGGCASATVSEATLTKTNEIDSIDTVEQVQYTFPHEDLEHEGTWLQWPHDKNFEDVIYDYEPIWIEMTRALVKGENVHLIVYDETEKERVESVLENEHIDLTRIDFFVFPYDDVWIRDNGPIFAYDENDALVIQDWKYNGWGNKMPYEYSDVVPTKISEATGIPKIDIDMIMEGGALELDGKGTLFSTLSCVNNDNRTPEFNLDEIEAYLSRYYGVTNFVWLNGVAGMDITDAHIDGMIKVLDENTIIAAPEFDPTHEDYDGEDPDVQILENAKNVDGRPYDFVYMPSTKKNVVKVDGEWMKGSYLNSYIGNAVILIPNYHDENDAVANAIMQELFPDKEIVGIDVRNLYVDGGMIHCVTQQQPISIIK